MPDFVPCLGGRRHIPTSPRNCAGIFVCVYVCVCMWDAPLLLRLSCLALKITVHLDAPPLAAHLGLHIWGWGCTAGANTGLGKRQRPGVMPGVEQRVQVGNSK